MAVAANGDHMRMFSEQQRVRDMTLLALRDQLLLKAGGCLPADAA